MEVDMTDFESIVWHGLDEDADMEPSGAAFMRGYFIEDEEVKPIDRSFVHDYFLETEEV